MEKSKIEIWFWDGSSVFMTLGLLKQQFDQNGSLPKPIRLFTEGRNGKEYLEIRSFEVVDKIKSIERTLYFQEGVKFKNFYDDNFCFVDKVGNEIIISRTSIRSVRYL